MLLVWTFVHKKSPFSLDISSLSLILISLARVSGISPLKKREEKAMIKGNHGLGLTSCHAFTHQTWMGRLRFRVPGRPLSHPTPWRTEPRTRSKLPIQVSRSCQPKPFVGEREKKLRFVCVGSHSNIRPQIFLFLGIFYLFFSRHSLPTKCVQVTLFLATYRFAELLLLCKEQVGEPFCQIGIIFHVGKVQAELDNFGLCWEKKTLCIFRKCYLIDSFLVFC